MTIPGLLHGDEFHFRRRWKANLMRNILESLAYWTENAKLLDESMMWFLRADQHSYSVKSAERTPLSPASKWIMEVLRCTQSISPDLFQAYMERVAMFWGAGDDSKEYNLARLELNHPSGPRPNRLLNFTACQNMTMTGQGTWRLGLRTKRIP